MTIISFPVEAFDENLSNVVGESTADWASRENYVGHFVFNPHLSEICKEIGIDNVILKHFTKEELDTKLGFIERSNKEQDEKFRDDLAKTKGFDAWSPNLLKDRIFTVQEVLLHRIAYPGLIPVPLKKFLILSDELTVQDDLMEKYLMVKLAV